MSKKSTMPLIITPAADLSPIYLRQSVTLAALACAANPLQWPREREMHGDLHIEGRYRSAYCTAYVWAGTVIVTSFKRRAVVRGKRESNRGYNQNFTKYL
jgi:hypothetical protein